MTAQAVSDNLKGAVWMVAAMAGFAVFSLASAVFLALHSAQTLRVLSRPERRGRDLGLFNLTNAKYAKLAKTSSDTSLRDLNDLVAKGILHKAPAGGRGTSYHLPEDD